MMRFPWTRAIVLVGCLTIVALAACSAVAAENPSPQ